MTSRGGRVGAVIVIFTRALVEGPTVKPGEFINRGRPAIIMHLMVGDCRSGGLLLGHQVIQEWLAPDPAAEEQVATREAAAEAAERLLSRLYLPSDVRGRLLSHETNEPIAGAEVFLEQAGMPTRIALTNERGEFLFGGMSRASFTLTTHAPRFYDERRAVPFSLGERSLILSLAPRPASLSGAVKDNAGAPMAGV